MRLSAAIIMKNEEDVAQRCLDCVSLFADEIVVVDTGSTDKTKEILAAHPKVRLFDSEFFNKDTHISDFRFNVAKNEAIGKCKGEWVIWWDADDFIDKDNAVKIANFALENVVRLYTFSIHYSGLVFEHCRMFRNGHGIEFDKSHSCHEYLNTKGYEHLARRDVIIQHRPGKKHAPAGNRNLSILEKDHFQRGLSDQRTLFYLANSYREAGRAPEALDFYSKYLAVSTWPEERFFARLYRAQVFTSMTRYHEAKKEAFLCSSEDSRFAEQFCLLGDLFLQDGDYGRAEAWFTLAMKTPFPKDAKLFVSPYMYGDYPKRRIADCLVKKDEAEKKAAAKKEAQAQPVKVEEFILPENRAEACLAAAALSNSAKRLGVTFGLDVSDPWVSELVLNVEGLRPATGTPVPLVPPAGLEQNAAARIVEYCTLTGVGLGSIGPMRMRGIDAFPVHPVVVFSHGWSGAQMVASGLGAVPMWESSFSDVVDGIAHAKVVVCLAGWVQHVARALGVPAVVLWDGHGGGGEWEDQANLRNCSIDKIVSEARRIAK
jgi:glycosyltransferase involved in cell wall biosynthesis